MTITIAIATAAIPASQARPAAAHSSSASGWENWRPSSRHTWCPPRLCSSFGPYTISRRAASRPDSPDRDDRRSRSSRSTGSLASIAPAGPPAPGPASLSGIAMPAPSARVVHLPESSAHPHTADSAGPTIGAARAERTDRLSPAACWTRAAGHVRASNRLPPSPAPGKPNKTVHRTRWRSITRNGASQRCPCSITRSRERRRPHNRKIGRDIQRSQPTRTVANIRRFTG